MENKYNVIIIGGGPSGIFAALELVKETNLNILLIEKGTDIENRTNVVSGFGGAGAFSDGKLTLSPLVGGQLEDYVGINELESLIKYVDEIYLKFGAPDRLYGTGEEAEEISHRASLAELRLIPVIIRHIGTEQCRIVIKAMRDYLNSKIDIRLESMVLHIVIDNGKIKGVETEDGQKFYCDYLIVAPGREGSNWLVSQASLLKLELYNNPVDIGVRVEVPAPVMLGLTDSLYEVKLDYISKSFDDRVRTFCMCPRGEVITETTNGTEQVLTVNGQSYANNKTNNTNFALLVSTTFTAPFHEPIAYGVYLARLANILSGGVLIQRLGDLLAGRRSTQSRIDKGLVKPTLSSAIPGDISFVLPYRQLTGIIEMLKAMDKLAPGIASANTLLYGIEVKFYSSRLKLNSNLETEISNMFAVGDGAGISRGLVQASASGVIAAREVIRRSK
ncbi:NAD(P)/FAD-dependent oxidoreductase [Chloroflexota bacterium]